MCFATATCVTVQCRVFVPERVLWTRAHRVRVFPFEVPDFPAVLPWTLPASPAGATLIVSVVEPVSP
jgi:hypothetical protein